jgi:hypothetical protein
VGSIYSTIRVQRTSPPAVQRDFPHSADSIRLTQLREECLHRTQAFGFVRGWPIFACLWQMWDLAGCPTFFVSTKFECGCPILFLLLEKGGVKNLPTRDAPNTFHPTLSLRERMGHPHLSRRPEMVRRPNLCPHQRPTKPNICRTSANVGPGYAGVSGLIFFSGALAAARRRS